MEKLSIKAFVADADRFVVYCIALIAFPLSGWFRWRSNLPHFDFIVFYTAGHFVNSTSLLNISAMTSYEKSHHFGDGLFPYLPAFAWLFAPFSHLAIAPAYFLYALFSIAVISSIAEMLARSFEFSRPLSYLLCFAWSPISAALMLGQNSIIGLALALAMLHHYKQKRSIVAGLLLGLLFYKPVYGIYIFIWMLISGEWLMCATAAMVGLAWYGACIVATGGNVHWLSGWLHVFTTYRIPDFISNEFAFIGIPGFLERIGMPFSVAGLIGLAILLATERFTKSLTRSDAFIILLALVPVVSLHAVPYDAAFTLPALLRILVLAPQRRFQILAFSYLVAATWLLSHLIRIDLLALVTLPCPFFLLWMLRTNAPMLTMHQHTKDALLVGETA